jgi:hypothetical protein
MTAPSCAAVQASLSDRLDGAIDLGDHVAAHLAGCADCQAFEATSRALRQALRVEPIDVVPDVAGAVTARLAASAPRRDRARPRPPAGRRPTLVVAVALVAGMVAGIAIGVVLVSPDGRLAPAAADVIERIPRAQLDVESLSARVRLTEWGWQAAVPRRTFAGDLAFRSPERLALRLRDETAYPGEGWVPDDVEAVLRPGAWWTRAPRPCPPPTVPSCARAPAETTAVIGVEPFDPTVPAPLDLVVPAAGFRRAPEPPSLGSRTVAGRPAVGVLSTASQVGDLLDGLRAGGNLRRFYPADRVELWLDEQALVPLVVTVSAADDPDRSVWAATQGAVERPGDEILRYELDEVRVNGAVPDERFPAPPPDAVVRPAGFVAAPVDMPATPPPGLAPTRSGMNADGTTKVRTWASGRGWVKVRVLPDAVRPGASGPVRPVNLTDGSPAFVDDTAGTVLVHGAGVQAEVSGSLPTADLVSVASSLAITGRLSPGGGAPAAGPSDATRAVPGIVLPVGLDRSDGIALRVDGPVVTAVVAGAGSRAVTLTATPGARLGPPFDMAVVAVDVRDRTGRYSAVRGELEWVEHGVAYSLRSTSLTRTELQAVARSMGPP